jgi:hypothetical protein
VEGTAIFTRRGLKVQQTKKGNGVEVVLPASLFCQRDYLLALSVTAPDGSINNAGTY